MRADYNYVFILHINSNKYFGEYSKANLDTGLIPNVQRGVWYYWYAY